MTDTHLLRYIIRRNGDTFKNLADAMGIGRCALSAKVNNRREFKQSEMIFISKRYNLTPEKCCKVFGGGEA